MLTSARLRLLPAPALPRAAAVALAVAGAVLAGIGLGNLAHRYGAAAPALLLLALAALAAAVVRPVLGIAFALLTVAFGNRELPHAPLGLQVVHAVVVVVLVAALARVAAFAAAPGRDWRTAAPGRDWRTAAPGRDWRTARPPLVAAAAVVAALLAASVAPVDPERAVKIDLTWLACLLFAVAVVWAARRPADVRLAVAAAALGSLPVTVSSLAASTRMVSVYDGAVVSSRPAGAFADPNEFGSFAAMSLLLATAWLLAARGRLERLAAAVVAVGAAAALALSLSRGAWLGAAIGLGVLAVLHRGARRLLVAAGAAALVAAAVAFVAAPASGPIAVLQDRIASLGNLEGNPYDVRPLTWGEAVREFAERPVVGQGPGSFAVLSAREPSAIQYAPRRHAHNGLLTVAAETGLIGIAAFGALAVALTVTVTRGARRLRAAGRFQDLALVAGPAAALSALCAHLLVDYPLRNPVLVFLTWALVAMAVAAATVAPDRDTG